ncbi:MAG: cysteine hydrolase family protein [Pseudonocardiaceae bacterium]
MRTGLIILDMLNDFVDGVLANPVAKGIIDPIARLVEEGRRRDDWVVIHANDAHQVGDFEFRVFGEHALAGSPGAQVVPALRPEPGDFMVPKRSDSAFADTDLDMTCRVQDLERVVIVGQHTERCCRHTAYEPAGRGNHEQRQQVALDYPRNCYATEVVGSRSLVNR